MNVPFDNMMNTLINFSIVWNNLDTGEPKSDQALTIQAQLEERMLDIISHIPKGQVS